MEKNRLRWRCRRGMRELDIVFERFLEHDFEHLSADQQTHFAALLEVPDPDIYAWLLRREAPRAEFQALIANLQRHLIVP
jgi:antitoxin CptB